MTAQSLLAAVLLAALLAAWPWALARRRARDAATARDRMAAELVRLMRAQRHGFMNHLQVIAGWLQLKKPERALAYIEAVRGKREQEGQLMRIASWELLVALLDKAHAAEAAEVDLQWRIESDLGGAPPEVAAFVAEAIDRALAAAAGGGDRRVRVRLATESGRHVVQVCGASERWERSFPPRHAPQRRRRAG